MSQNNADPIAVLDECPVRVLHLWDFHFNTERAWDSDSVLLGLSQAIQHWSPTV